MKVANVKLKVETRARQFTVGTETYTNTTVETKFEEVRGYSDFDVIGNMLIFYNAGKNGEHVSYNQDNVVEFTTYIE